VAHAARVTPAPGPRVPATARVCDYLGGGHQNYEADAAMAARLTGLYPAVARMAARNRRYLAGQVRVAEGLGITRFLDLGSGFPSPGTAAMAAAAIPGAQVACVDWDRSVTRYAAKLERDGVANVSLTHADIRGPAAVLARPAVAAVLAGGPVCVIFGTVLHMMTRAAAARTVAGYAAGVAAGSMVIVTVLRGDDAALFRSVSAAWQHAAGIKLVNYSLAGIEGLLAGAGLEVQPPGAGPVLLAGHGSPGKVLRRLYVAGAAALTSSPP
jgi:S-adenosyl methyltransferase